MSIQARSNLHAPIAFEVGDDWLILVSCSNADGTPMDLTSAALEWKLADIATGKIIVATLTVGSGITIQAPVMGVASTCLIWLTHTATAAIAPGFYRDQLRVTAGALVSTQMKGRIEAVSVI